jgi:replicative DNA helicase
MPLVTLSDAMENVIGEVEQRVAVGGVKHIGLQTGFEKFDETTGGLRDGSMYIVAGRTGLGKSSFGLNVAMTVAQQQKEVLFLSLEMNANLLALRLLAAQTGISAMDIEYGRLDTHQLQAVQDVKERTKGLSFALYDDSITSEALTRAVEQRKIEKGLDLLVVDYLTLLRDQAAYGEVERLSTISGNLQGIAASLNIPVIALAQLNREVERREGNMPTLSDIRGSGSIEQDGAVVVFVYRPHYYAMMHDGEEPVEVEEDAKLIIAKNRFGPTGVINVNFHTQLMEWRDKNYRIQQPQNTNMGSLVAKVRER